MEGLKKKTKSVKFKLFFTMCIVITIIVGCLVIANNVVLETFYLYSKTNTVKGVYENINNKYKNSINLNLERELRKIAFDNNFDIFIKTSDTIYAFAPGRDFKSTINIVSELEDYQNKANKIILKKDNMVIKKIEDINNNINYILLTGLLDNGTTLYIKIPVVPIEESVRISNEVLITIGIITLIIAAIISSYVSNKFTKPILQLNDIANKMSKLNFKQKYRVTNTDDEINELGKSINVMSDKLETTIKQLRENNMELEKDIEEKSKIDEMRKQFISDVSHELKTPISLIQGYAEGLLENVNTDENSRKFYAEVISDEANKMDQLVKQLLELMKLEYGKREFNNKEFDVVEITKEVVKKCEMIAKEKNITIKINSEEQVCVNADEFYIEQVIRNYLTNALKHCKEKNGRKEIAIYFEKAGDKIRVSVFNTGDNISEENLEKIWGRFYKVDNSRNREEGGTGVGLALVKAIMNNYKNNYGVINKEDGVEFYFEVEKTNFDIM